MGLGTQWGRLFYRLDLMLISTNGLVISEIALLVIPLLIVPSIHSCPVSHSQTKMDLVRGNLPLSAAKLK